MNFSWAMDLDPKGANNQIKEAIDKRYLPDDEEPITREEQISECYPYESGLCCSPGQHSSSAPQRGERASLTRETFLPSAARALEALHSESIHSPYRKHGMKGCEIPFDVVGQGWW